MNAGLLKPLYDGLWETITLLKEAQPLAHLFRQLVGVVQHDGITHWAEITCVHNDSIG
jgi:hypothetical protein